MVAQISLYIVLLSKALEEEDWIILKTIFS